MSWVRKAQQPLREASIYFRSRSSLLLLSGTGSIRALNLSYSSSDEAPFYNLSILSLLLLFNRPECRGSSCRRRRPIKSSGPRGGRGRGRRRERPRHRGLRNPRLDGRSRRYLSAGRCRCAGFWRLWRSGNRTGHGSRFIFCFCINPLLRRFGIIKKNFKAVLRGLQSNPVL